MAPDAGGWSGLDELRQRAGRSVRPGCRRRDDSSRPRRQAGCSYRLNRFGRPPPDSLIPDPNTQIDAAEGTWRPNKTVVVGTDGSESSLRAVERAGRIAADSRRETGHCDRLFTGKGPSARGRYPRGGRVTRSAGGRAGRATPHDARDRAKAAGAKKSRIARSKTVPVHALVDLAEEVGADLLVVGNVDWTREPRSSGGCSRSREPLLNRAKIDVLDRAHRGRPGSGSTG